MNEWGSKETKGLIKDILPPDAVDATTKVILANAVYFKGAWTRKFNTSVTKEHDFYLLNGSSVRAPLMRNGGAQDFGAFDGFKVVRLPYMQGKDRRMFSMYIYLPDAKDGLPSLRERMCSQSGFIDTHLPSGIQDLDKLLIPKFKFEMRFEASTLLRGLGIVHLFGGGELNEMVDSPYPTVGTKIYHKAFIEVNEEGTEAAAVSVAAVVFGSCALPVERPRLEFVADHPFMFVIREDTTSLVLFIGQLLNPLASS